MQYTLDNIKPQDVWQEFYGMCKIPRGSGNEKGISNYLKDRFEQFGYKVEQDKVGDIHVIREKDADVASNVSICLQAHMDMVCSKKNDTIHDFLKDPIKPRVTTYDGMNVVMATGTTLGADDGTGVATILALFKEGQQKQHWPRLEALITVNEEQLMTGAMSVSDNETHVDAPIVNPEGKPIHLSSDFLLNLDSEDIKIITVSSAGGANFEFKFDFASEKLQLKENETAFEIAVKGCIGGHSGTDANKYIASAIKQCARLLTAAEKYQVRCHTFIGGTAHNAIPMDCSFHGVIEASKFDAMKQEIEKLGAEIKAEYQVTDPHMQIVCEKCGCKEVECISVADTQRLIDFISLVPAGVFRMSAEIKGLTETSASLGVVKFTAGQVGCGLYLARSCVNCELANIDRQLGQLCKIFNIGYSGAKDEYLGWATSPEHDFVKTTAKCYADACKCKQEEIKIDAIHAGLECGQLMANNKCFQAAASIGPSVYYPHSDRELCVIETVEPFYMCVKNILETYANKQ